MIRALLVLCLCLVVTVLGAARLNAQPDFIEDRETVEVAWDRVESPTSHDYIALYSPISDRSFANKSVTVSSPWSRGYGAVSFDLINMRQPYEFRYMRKVSSGVYQCEGTSNTVKVNPLTPLGGHIALTNDPSRIRVSWTDNSTATPTVIVGTDKKDLSMTFTGVSTTYKAEDMCGEDFDHTFHWWPPGNIHHVVLTGLAPKTKYYYSFGAGKDFSPRFSFVTPPKVGDKSKTVNAIVFGDMGSYLCQGFPQYNQCDSPAEFTLTGIRKALKREEHDVLLHIGDISYAKGRMYVWDQFMYSIEPVATRVPYMVAIGNHDFDYTGQDFRPSWGNYNTDSGGECGIPTFARFVMPNATLAKPWFSFDVGIVHFVVMSTEHNFLVGSPQYQWIANDLAKVDRKATPWIVFSGHRPMYYTVKSNPLMDNLRANLEPILAKFKVNLALWGHVHAYERTCPVINQTCDRRGTTHVLIGNAGRELSYFNTLPKKWSLVRGLEYGWSRFSANETHLSFEAYANAGHQMDAFTIPAYY